MMRKCLCIFFSLLITMFMITNTYSGASKAIGEQEIMEVVSLRSECEKHFDNGDGTITNFVYAQPLHYYENGEWIEIDNTLIQDESGNYVNKSNSMNVTLASSTSVNTFDVNEQQMIKIDYNDYSISWRLISNQSDNVAYSFAEDVSIPISNISINDLKYDENISIGNSQLNEKVFDSVEKLESSVSYDSLYNGIDFDIDVCASSVKETIVINNRENVLGEFKYYIKSDGLSASIFEDNSIHFINEYGEDIFIIPPAFMFDSSDNAENNYNIQFNIEEYENGYLLTLIPDLDWLLRDERIYPVMIDPEFKTSYYNTGIQCRYNTQAEPYLIYNNGIKIGDKENDGYQTYVSLANLFTSYNPKASIVSANFYMKVNPIVLNSSKQIDVYSTNTLADNICWNNDSDLDTNNTYIGSFDVYSSSKYTQYGVDITSLAQAWLNYSNTSRSNIGVCPYGFKMVTNSSSRYPATITAYNGTVADLNPFYVVIYTLSSDYTLDYAPHKYNDITPPHTHYGNIYNFQKKMNCYAYALQVYYQGTGNYYLRPGEFGISNAPKNDVYKITNYNDLNNQYIYFRENIYEVVREICTKKGINFYNLNSSYKEVESDPEFLSKISLYSDFIEEQMRRDSVAMNFSMQKVKYSSNFSYDESKERIIAMVTYYRAKNAYGEQRVLDYHFYLRNGNGTCEKKGQEGHSANCSIWSQKQGTGPVTNKGYNYVLCDANLSAHAYEFTQGYAYLKNEDDIRYYKITKDTNVYNSYHGKGQNEDSTGTPYYHK